VLVARHEQSPRTPPRVALRHKSPPRQPAAVGPEAFHRERTERLESLFAEALRVAIDVGGREREAREASASAPKALDDRRGRATCPQRFFLVADGEQLEIIPAEAD